MVLEASRAYVRGTPSVAVTLAEIADIAYFQPGGLPEGVPAGLEASARYQARSPMIWANATHVCTCEVDVTTGAVTLLRYIVSEDCGPMINPNVVEGQIAGGTVQGIGGVLLEHLAYDEDGNPLTTTFMDYLLPTAYRRAHHRVRARRDPGARARRLQGRRRGRRHRCPAGRRERRRRRAGALRRGDHPAAPHPGRDRRPARGRAMGRSPRPNRPRFGGQPPLTGEPSRKHVVPVKPAPFEYHRPRRPRAVGLLAELGDAAKVLAGGQSLVPMLALRLAVFEHLVDIGRVEELRGIERADGTVRIGAGTTQAAIERSAEVAEAVPLLARATPLIGHFQIRNRGTIGGSLAHADPAAEYPAVALALDAELEVLGHRRAGAPCPPREFFTGLWSTAVGDDELLTAVTFPVWSGRCGFAVREFARRHGDFAIAGAAVAVELDDDDRVRRCGIGLLGLGSTAQRAAAAEAAVIGMPVGDARPDRRRPAGGRRASKPCRRTCTVRQTSGAGSAPAPPPQPGDAAVEEARRG